LRNEKPYYGDLLLARLEKLSFIILFFILHMVGCGSTELEKISITPDRNSLTIEIGFNDKTPYTIQSEENNMSLVLRTPDTNLSKIMPEQKLIPGNEIISGWFARKIDNTLEVQFFLTDQYAFSDSDILKDQTTSSESPYTVIITVNDDNVHSPAEKPIKSTISKQTRKPLTKGIELFHQNLYDEALTEFNTVVNMNEHCPLAYYYAALIRLQKNQYSVAKNNLIVALRDSANFTDAVGYLAFTLKKMGNTEGALTEWRRFVAVAGTTGENALTIESTIPPEQYREKLVQIQKERVAEEMERKKFAAQRIEMEKAASEEKSTPSTLAQPDTSAGEQAQETKPLPHNTTNIALKENSSRLSEFGDRTKTNIRKGIYSIIITTILLAVVITFIILKLRKRSIAKAELTFSKEIDRFIQDREESEEKGRIIADDINIIPVRPVSEIPLTQEPLTVISFEEPDKSNITPAYSAIQDDSNGRHPITEEIKALVTRMHREGRTIEEICRASDLTKTEVELIIAVRSKHMEYLVEAATINKDEFTDADHLYHAISELRQEGYSSRIIAKKLGISTGEIDLALAVLKEEKNNA
jgi:tetratricopeptide (TPR) repeat protein